MELSYNPAILLLSIYIQRKWNSVSDRYVHSQVYCSIVHNSQVMGKPKYPSRNDRIKILNTHTHTHIYTYGGILLSYEKEGNPASCDNMDGHYASEISQKKVNIIWYPLYVESKQKGTWKKGAEWWLQSLGGGAQ